MYLYCTYISIAYFCAKSTLRLILSCVELYFIYLFSVTKYSTELPDYNLLIYSVYGHFNQSFNVQDKAVEIVSHMTFKFSYLDSEF